MRAPDIWFIGDTHWGHANILKYEADYRPFKHIHEHDEALIENWNSVVKDEDTIFHLGDFCFGRKNIHIAKRLNGKKRLIMGNHDCYPIQEYGQYFQSIHGMLYYKEFVLTHAPTMRLPMRAQVNIHGHLHSKNVMLQKLVGNKMLNTEIRDPDYFNCSVEQIGLTPIHIEQVRWLIGVTDLKNKKETKHERYTQT